MGGRAIVLLSRTANAVAVSGARRVLVAGSGGGVPWVVVPSEGPPYVYTSDPDGVPPGVSGRPLAWNPQRIVDDLRSLVSSGELKVAFDTISPGFLALLERAFPGIEYEDAERLLERSWRLKDERQTEALAAAAAVADAAVARIRGHVVTGASEREVAALASVAAIEEGASFLAAEPSVRVRSAGRPPGRVSGARRFRDGDLVSIEVAIVRDGVQGESATTVFAGEPTSPALELERRWREAIDRIADTCRAGAGEAELRAAVPAGVAGTPLLLHGIGTGVEPPFVDLRYDPRPLRLLAGMVVVVSAELADPKIGSFRGSRTVAVGSGAPRVLSRAHEDRA